MLQVADLRFTYKQLQLYMLAYYKVLIAFFITQLQHFVFNGHVHKPGVALTISMLTKTKQHKHMLSTNNKLESTWLGFVPFKELIDEVIHRIFEHVKHNCENDEGHVEDK